MMKKRKKGRSAAGTLITGLCLAAGVVMSLGGLSACQKRALDAGQTAVESGLAAESGTDITGEADAGSDPADDGKAAGQESNGQESNGEESMSPGTSADPDGRGETAESAGETGAAGPDGETGVQKKIVIATDLHYLAEELSGNRCESFMTAVRNSDGRALQYGWEILDAFIEDMIKEKPDMILLSGDLTLNGEKKSHEELAKKLGILLDNDIPVLVIPGNHDINNPMARSFSTEGAKRTDSVTAEEFEEIYADFGYGEADSRDKTSLSYTYALDDYYSFMMLDTCQYDPVNRVGGMIGHETYDWIEEELLDGWEQGAQFLTVSHHNLLDQSGVSREFYDDCTIEHNEELIQRLYDGHVRLHLSGHLHLQHYLQDEDTEIREIVTGSLVMAPCHYGLLKIMDSGELIYDAGIVDVEGWAKRHSYKNRALTDFKTFSEDFLRQVTYQNALKDLRRYTLERKLFLSDERIEQMAEFYARLCVYYYGGRMFEIVDQMKQDPAFRYWNEVDYVSDLSDFLRNILNDDAKDFSHLKVPY